MLYDYFTNIVTEKINRLPKPEEYIIAFSVLPDCIAKNAKDFFRARKEPVTSIIKEDKANLLTVKQKDNNQTKEAKRFFLLSLTPDKISYLKLKVITNLHPISFMLVDSKILNAFTAEQITYITKDQWQVIKSLPKDYLSPTSPIAQVLRSTKDKTSIKALAEDAVKKSKMNEPYSEINNSECCLLI